MLHIIQWEVALVGVCLCLFAFSTINARQPNSPFPNETPSPVELTYFTGKHVEQQYNLLEWQTAQEINAAYYSIEKSTDGLHFEAIGRMEAQGNTDQTTNYQFIDNEWSGITYYRLQQVDIDGSSHFSPIIAINAPWVFLPITNPIPKRLSLEVKTASKWQWEVYSVTGQLICQKAVEKNIPSIHIDTQNWTSGHYILIVTTKSSKWNKLLQKL